VLDAHASNKMIFLQEIYVFIPPSWKGLFGANRAYLQLERPKLQEVFLEKLSQFSLSHNALDAHASHTDGFLSSNTNVSST